MSDELLLRLESFEIDRPGVAFPFSARLARENGWNRGYSRRVVREYLRFVWLAMRAGHPVTPSEQVDEAWHLHLCYTRSYWDEMCGQLLGKPLHHGPTEGGESEDAKFADWYGKTLESYRLHFAEEPPADIWPAIEERFQPVKERRVDSRSHWILSKRSVIRWVAGAVAITALPVLAGCTPLMADIEPGGLLCFGLMFFAIFLVAKIAKALGHGTGRRSDNSAGCGGSSCGSDSSGCGSSHNSGGDSSSESDSSGCGSSGCSSSGCGGGGGGD